MQSNKELVLSTSDLTAVGINAQLTSNDLVEVVAHDIYTKFSDSVDTIIENGKKIDAKASELFNSELEDMKNTLIKAKFLTEKEISDSGFGAPKGVYWNSDIYIQSLRHEEVSAGTRIKKDSHRFNYPPTKNSKVRLYINVSDSDKEEVITLNGVKGNIETRVCKNFYKEVVPTQGKIKNLLQEIREHNEQVESVFSFLPKSKILSVERFTREARVKMNKKIISSQSPEFRNKMSQLFNIKL